MDLSRTVSEINGDFSRKSQIFPDHPAYFAPPLKGFAMELGIGARHQKLDDWATRPNKNFVDIFSRVDTMHQRNRQTDRHRATAKTALTPNIAL